MQTSDQAGDQQNKINLNNGQSLISCKPKIRTNKCIKAYIYGHYGSLKKPSIQKLSSFKTLEEGLEAFKAVKPRYDNQQVVFIDYSTSPSRIIHVLN